MTWTYSAASLSSSDLYKVRLIIGDADTNRQQLQDEEINYVLTVEAVVTYAAAACCDILAAKYAFQVNTENSELRVSAAARHKHYLELADRLRATGGGDIPGGEGGGLPVVGMYAGGTLKSEKETLIDDTDIVAPAFALGQDDNPEAGEDDPRSLQGS